MSIYFYVLLAIAIISAVWQRFNQQTIFVRKMWKEVPPSFKKIRQRDKKLTSLQQALVLQEERTPPASKFIGYQVNFRGRIIDISNNGEVKMDLEIDKGLGIYYFHFFGNTYARFFLSIPDAKELKLKKLYSFVGQLADVIFDNDNIANNGNYYTWVTLEFSGVKRVVTPPGRLYSPMYLMAKIKARAFPPRPVLLQEMPTTLQEVKDKFHKLEDIIMIILCSLLSGVNDWVDMEDFANDHEDWFRSFLELPNGIPSHDTLSAVLARLTPALFAEQFTAWMEATLSNLAGKPLAINGNELTGYAGQPVHLMGIFVSETNLLDEHASVHVKCNELTSIPTLLKLLNLQGATLLIDTMDCQKAIIKDIIESGADYILALKNNHPNLHEDITLGLNSVISAGRLPTWEKEREQDNKRIERRQKNLGHVGRRRYWLSDQIDWFNNRSDWPNLNVLGRVEQRVEINGEVIIEHSELLSSLTNLKKLFHIIREHCDSGNQQQWLLNIHLDEGEARTDTDHAPENIALMRKITLNLIRRNGTGELSVRRHRNKAMASDQYRQQLLIGAT